MYSILLTKKAEKELLTLENKVQKRIGDALDEMMVFGTSALNLKKLQTPFPGFRKRVGDYRILFEVNDSIVIIYKIDKRSDAYR